jgi:hypothetical protein
LGDNGWMISVDWCSNAGYKLHSFCVLGSGCNPDPGKIAIGIIMPPRVEVVACHCCGEASFFCLYNKSE